jgi:uncharacterized OB-fold protein
VQVSALATYRPTWADSQGRRQLGPDEDVATLAVSAGLLLADRLSEVVRVVLLTRRPDALLGTAPEVVLEGLGLDRATPVVEQIGGAPATVEALLAAGPGTLILAVDPRTPAAAAAALVGPGPIEIEPHKAVRYSVPVRTAPLPGAVDLTYDDPRLLRERGWKRVVREVAGDLADLGGSVAVAGVPASDAAKLLRGVTHGVAETEAASPLLVLAALAANGEGARLVAVENGFAVAVDVSVDGSQTVVGEQRAANPAPPSWDPRVPGEIPASPAAYERAFEAKVGLKAGVCACGRQHYPPRAQCMSCGELDQQTLEPLPRAAAIYSVVTVRAGVPGKNVPYSLAVVDVDDTDVRVLAHVTDTVPGSAAIGASGRLVLRRVAVRAGVPDYGYAFQPDAVQPEEQQA